MVAFTPYRQAIALEEGGVGPGVQFDNLELDGFPPFIAMLAIDTAIYLLLAFYLNNVCLGDMIQSYLD